MYDIGVKHLGDGDCIELYHVGGDRDGMLAGYVIWFSGGWDAYVRQPDATLRQVGINMKTKDLAYESVKRRL